MEWKFLSCISMAGFLATIFAAVSAGVDMLCGMSTKHVFGMALAFGGLSFFVFFKTFWDKMK